MRAEGGAPIFVDGKIRAVELDGRRVPVRAASDGRRVLVWCDGQTYEFGTSAAPAARLRSSSEEAGLRAPMPGKVLRVLVAEGDEVARGNTLLILEAMKMEHEIKAPAGGRIARIPFAEGDQVEAGAKLVEFAT
ncbi:MAG: acetyl-CoA carboxylase biotin carboxyl carrier protein subunit [Thermoanaerobaculia bacterium]